MSSAFEWLLPSNAVVVEAAPSMWNADLAADEERCIRYATSKRRREFTAGRTCARAALHRLGISNHSIPVDHINAPIFPKGISGTITHTASYCAAAVIRKIETAAIGIDAEVNDQIPREMRHLIVASDEENAIFRDSENAPFDPIKIAFSAKEAFYKAFYQQAEQFLEWRDVLISLQLELSTFSIRMLKRDVPSYFHQRTFLGRFCVDDRRVYTAIALPMETRNRMAGSI